MSKASPIVFTIAQQILCAEAPGIDRAVRACEELRASLTVLTGAGGYASLVSRALATAKGENAELKRWRGRSDGSLQRMTPSDVGEDTSAGVILMAHLLALLIRIVGEGVTARSIPSTWPHHSSSEYA